MSREIKFRAWVNNHWVDWIPTCKTLGAYNASIIDTDGYTFEEDNPFIVEQYTGLKDKNGKEIYEGDILTWTDGFDEKHVFRVEWQGNRAKFCLRNLGDHWDYEEINDKKQQYMVVIGNVHDNQELLGGEE